jgi:hypothetical protein
MILFYLITSFFFLFQPIIFCLMTPAADPSVSRELALDLTFVSVKPAIVFKCVPGESSCFLLLCAVLLIVSVVFLSILVLFSFYKKICPFISYHILFWPVSRHISHVLDRFKQDEIKKTKYCVPISIDHNISFFLGWQVATQLSAQRLCLCV